LEEIVMASHVRPQVAAFRCNVETRELYRTSRLLSHVTGVFPQPNKAIVGRNAFAHEAGIHQHGVMQNGLTYEIMRPETVGVAASVRMTGPWAGERAAEAKGDGPIAATFAAVSEIVGQPIEVGNLVVQSVTPGRDSLGQVSLQARVNGKSLSGHGASTDIVEASARALVNALNKSLFAERLEADSLNSVYLWGV